MKSHNAAIQALIQDFADKLVTLVQADIIHSLTAIVGGAASTSAKPGKAPKAAARGKGAKRSPDELEGLTKRLFAYVGKNPGQRIEQIGAGMGVTTKDLRLPVVKLLAEKKLAARGVKRATSYSVKG